VMVCVGWLVTALCLQPATAGTFWHISDLHLDHLYREGGNISNWCHSNQLSQPTPHDLGAGPVGDYHCDSPLVLVLSALEAMARFQPNPEFIVWTGDSAPHWKEPTPPNASYITNVTSTVFTKLGQLFPRTPIIPALGNHDSSPPDQFPISTTQHKTPLYYSQLLDQGGFGLQMDDVSKDTFIKCGYYTKVLHFKDNGVRFVVLNTNIYYGDNFTTGEDPCEQMAWLNQTLESATEPVFIVAHVPPGSFERGGRDGFKINFNTPKEHCHDINNRLVQIVSEQDNSGKIKGHLYGHLHTDTFRVFLDRATSATPRGCGFMAGSVTPVVWAADGDKGTGVVGVNPSIRLFEYRDSDFTLLDYHEYALDITDKELNKGSSMTLGNTETETKATNVDASRRRKRQISPAVPAVPGQTTVSTPKVEADVPDQSTVPSLKAEETNSEETTSAPLPVLTTIQPLEDETITSGHVNKTENAEPTNMPNNVTENVSPKPVVSVVNNSMLPTNASSDSKSVTKEHSTESETAVDKAARKLAKQWKFLYNATKAFNVADLTPTSMFEAVKVMVAEGPQGSIFRSYYQHNTLGHKRQNCEDSCWRGHMCSITRLVETELDACTTSKDNCEFYYDKSCTQSNKTQPTAAFNDNLNLTPRPTDSPVVDIFVSTGPPDSKDVHRHKIQDPSYITTNAVSIFFGLVGLVALVAIFLLGYKKYKERRYRNQEFLLTDSVFRYDGYSQLDDD